MPPKSIREPLSHEWKRHSSSLDVSNEMLHTVLTVLEKVQKDQKNIMSKITDFATKEQADLAAVSASLDAVVTGITALDELIKNFQNSPGTLSAEDQAALDGIQTASADLVTKAGGISTTPPTVPVV